MGMGMFTFVVGVITALLVWDLSGWLGTLALLAAVAGAWAGGTFAFLTGKMGFTKTEASNTPPGATLVVCWTVMVALLLFALLDWL